MRRNTCAVTSVIYVVIDVFKCPERNQIVERARFSSVYIYFCETSTYNTIKYWMQSLLKDPKNKLLTPIFLRQLTGIDIWGSDPRPPERILFSFPDDDGFEALSLQGLLRCSRELSERAQHHRVKTPCPVFSSVCTFSWRYSYQSFIQKCRERKRRQNPLFLRYECRKLD